MIRTHFFPQVKARGAPSRTKVQQAPSSTRAGLISQLFEALDADGDGFLSEQEMHGFARHMGFDGGADKWKVEYDLLFDGTNLNPAEGVTLTLFAQLVDDESDAGCYCTDDELKKFCSAEVAGDRPYSSNAEDRRTTVAASRSRSPPGLEPFPAAQEYHNEQATTDEDRQDPEAWEWCTETLSQPLPPTRLAANGTRQHDQHDTDEGWASWETWQAAAAAEAQGDGAGDGWQDQGSKWSAGDGNDWWTTGNDWSRENWWDSGAWQGNAKGYGRGGSRESSKGKGKGGKKRHGNL